MKQEALISAKDRIAAWLLFAAAALAPLPFGSVQSSAVAFWCIALGICLVLAPVHALGGGRLALVALAGLVVASYAVVLHEQLAAHPWLPGATADPIWAKASAALGVPLAPSVSIARNQPWFALGRTLVCMLAIACGFLVGTDRVRARRLLKVIAWSGAGYAAYGILTFLVDPTHILGRDKSAYFESVTGTFINRNTAGAYFGSCAVVWSLLLWERVRRDKPRGPLDWLETARRVFSTPPKDVVVAFAMLFLCLAAMFMTRSRGAIVLSLFALVIAFIAFFWRDLPRRTGILAGLVGSGAVALTLLQLLGAGVNARFDSEGLASEGRTETYKATLRLIADHPWFGTGAGTFAQAFPAYRSANVSMSGVWDMAHNTLLEIAAEMGVPIATLVIVAWITIFVVLVRGALIRRRDLIMPVGGLAVATLAVLHSLIDFSLQIPGYAIVALSLIGAGLAQSFSARQGNGDAYPEVSQAEAVNLLGGGPKTEPFGSNAGGNPGQPILN
jgi:O-antigen ligase